MQKKKQKKKKKEKEKEADPLLIKECTKYIDETELVWKTSNESECRCSLCTNIFVNLCNSHCN